MIRICLHLVQVLVHDQSTHTHIVVLSEALRFSCRLFKDFLILIDTQLFLLAVLLQLTMVILVEAIIIAFTKEASNIVHVMDVLVV